MKLSIKLIVFTIALLPGFFLTGTAFADDQPGCLRLKERKMAFTALAKGTTMEVDFKLSAHDCHLAMDSGSSTAALTTELPPGLESITGPTVFGKERSSEKYPATMMAGEMTIPVFITMPGDLAPGTYNIPAKLSYEAINRKGDRVQESMTLAIPLKVVGTKAEVHPIVKPDHWGPLKMTGIIAAAIVLSPVLVALGIFGFVTGIPVLSDC